MKIGMVFPGYGSQFVGMGKELYDDSRVMQEYFETATNCLNNNFVKLCFASSDTELGRIENAYPALFLVSSALAAALKKAGITPDVVAGFDHGEYAAIHTAGGLSFPDGLYALSKNATLFAQLLENIKLTGIVLTGLPTVQVRQLCKQVSTDGVQAYIAFYGIGDEHGIIGHPDALKNIRNAVAENEAVQVEDFDVEGGAHSIISESIVEPFKGYLKKVDFNELSVPLISASDAQEHKSGSTVKDAVVEQLTAPVLWREVVGKLHDCDIILAVGPGIMLAEQLKQVYPDKHVLAINNKADIDAALALLPAPESTITE